MLLFLFLVFGFSFSFYSDGIFNFENSNGGGGGMCAGCTVAVKLLKGISDYQEMPIEKLLDEICTIFKEKPEWEKKCVGFIDVLEPLLIQFIEIEISPDEICRKMKFCENFEQCTLFPDSGKNHFYDTRTLSEKEFTSALSALEELKRVIIRDKTDPHHQWPYDPIPDVDSDSDGFSPDYLARGSAWRGKDCDDENANVYPGRKVNPSSNSAAGLDYNCNGIKGIDNSTQMAYEDLLCGESDRRGLIAIGDSVTAHFHIPPELFYPNVSLDSLSKFVIPFLMNEVDWPELSLYTGYMNDSTGYCTGPVDSVYLHLRNDHNLCNHRDYQNLGVNGARSSKLGDFAQLMSRNPNTDHPVVVISAFVGDDVCTPHHSFDAMTQPQEFYNNIVRGLKILDTKVPKGSFVVMVGLVKGTALYYYLHGLKHPIGVPYPVVYDYLNCLESNPCWGWCQTNATIRNMTQQHADLLNDQYIKIMNSGMKFENFKYYYISSQEIQMECIKEWGSEGHDLAQLIEPVDGFHPSQILNSLMGKKYYEKIMQLDSSILGAVNPNNPKIKELFKNQGGH